MRSRVNRTLPWLVLTAAAVAASACGDRSSPTSPSTEHVSGVWMGHITLRSVGGGECVGPTLQSSVGNSRDIFAAHIQQNAESLTATVGYQGNQTSCSFAGSVRGDTVTLTMNSCQADRVRNVRCANGDVRDLQLVGDSMTGHAATGYGVGSETSTWTVTAPGSTTSLGTLTLSADFVWNMLGIPHSDFHVFDGSILPGYVDGTVVIPEEVNPFCDKCGWFQD
ncbi:MAG TPA: hypothetical protein VKB50_23245 [Vicinamibacterales bacterium]|nr:hypothetical protein [Vicinamibacterales bacterium]